VSDQYNLTHLQFKLHGLLRDISDEGLRGFLFFVLSDQLGEQFMSTPAARSRHHASPGGLAYHSIWTASLAQEIAQHYKSLGKEINEDLVVAGALLHDVGKIWAYEWVEAERDETYHGETEKVSEPGYTYTKASFRHHHIPLGYREVYRLGIEYNKDRNHNRLASEDLDELLHIILSHHGNKAWSSPVIPQTTEAYIVHMTEFMDSTVDKYCAGKPPKSLYG
jgi:3'-5' exoribonuclease